MTATNNYHLSLHDALPIYTKTGSEVVQKMYESAKKENASVLVVTHDPVVADRAEKLRSEEHTSELQSPDHLVFRLLLEKKKERVNVTEWVLAPRHPDVAAV